jgi:hypothetical protein
MKVLLNCSICRKEFYKYVSTGTFPAKNHYCSNLCKNKGISQKGYKKSRVDKGVGRGRIEKKCLTCGNIMSVIPSLRGRKSFCKKDCLYEHMSKLMSGENNPAWINGSSYLKDSYRGDDWETIRKKIYKRDNWTCRICGVKCISRRRANENNFYKVIQCHHIIKYKETFDNSDNNLITVCLRCHAKLDIKERRGQDDRSNILLSLYRVII